MCEPCRKHPSLWLGATWCLTTISRRFTITLLGFTLAACGSSRERVQIAVPPAQYLTCKAEPAVPASLTDATVAAFIVDLRGAGADCRGKLKAVRDWSAEVTKPQS